MGISPGIDDDTLQTSISAVNKINDFALVISLMYLRNQTQADGFCFDHIIDLLQSLITVNFRFANTQHIKIWSVD
ncbi:hypothetical protein SDC9_208969 [bioreactor metagenome]|uniref:Uncharacterized protein n=1 Tax=bioreactor metagenome TaxID=1076179 RepID=A0A645JBZ2_9ZZZZ